MLLRNASLTPLIESAGGNRGGRFYKSRELIFFFPFSLRFIGIRERLASRAFGCLIKNFISSPEKRSGGGVVGLGGMRGGLLGGERFDISAAQMLRIIKIVPTCVSLLEPAEMLKCCCGASCSNWPECKLSTRQPPQREKTRLHSLLYSPHLH